MESQLLIFGLKIDYAGLARWAPENPQGPAGGEWGRGRDHEAWGWQKAVVGQGLRGSQDVEPPFQPPTRISALPAPGFQPSES